MLRVIQRLLLCNFAVVFLLQMLYADGEIALNEIKKATARYEAFVKKHGGKKPTHDELQAIAANNRNDAEELYQAHMLRGQIGWLDRAMVLKPNTPRFLMRAACHGHNGAVKRAKYARVLLQMQPDNKAASYLLAAALFDQLKPEEAIKVLKAARRQTKLQDYAIENILGMEKFLVDHGSSSIGAEIISTVEQSDPLLIVGLKISKGILRYVADMPRGKQLEFRRLGYDAGESLLSQRAVPTLVHEMIAFGVQLKVLEGMDPDQVSPVEGLDVGELRKHLLAKREKTIKKARRGNDIDLDALKLTTIRNYIKLYRNKGEIAANAQLFRQIKLEKK